MSVFKAFILVALLLVATSCEREPHERVLGDHGSQPATVVTALPGNQSPDTRQVIESAKSAVAPLGDQIWPEPSRLVEGDTKWDVWFDFREKLVEIDGKQSIRMQAPEAAMVEVQKSDLSARLIPGR